VLVYQIAYKETIDFGVDLESHEVENWLDNWTEIVVIEVDDETGAVLGGFGYAFGFEYVDGKKTKDTWSEGPWDIDAEEFIVGPLNAKEAIFVYDGDEPGLGKLKDGVLVSATGAATGTDFEVESWVEAWLAEWKLRLDGALTKQAATAMGDEGDLEDVIPVIQQYLHKKGFLND